MGGSFKGEGQSSNVRYDVSPSLVSLDECFKLICVKTADVIVDEIRLAGGKAVANYDSVENGDNIIDTAIKEFGRIDVLLNNAGILRDVSFKNMTDDDWDLTIKVHVKGAYKVCPFPLCFNSVCPRNLMRAAISVQGLHGLISESKDMAELSTLLLPRASLVILVKPITLVGSSRKNLPEYAIDSSSGQTLTSWVYGNFGEGGI